MFQDGFPQYLENDANQVENIIKNVSYSVIKVGITEDHIQYYINGNMIRFPVRMYYKDISELDSLQLSPVQTMILHCIFTRNNDGFVRQKHLRALLSMDYEDWVIPYIVKLSDEYVIEILEMIYDYLKYKDNERIKQFCYENVEAFSKSYTRMISYWNEYYRNKDSKFSDYIGRKLYWECFGYTNRLRKIIHKHRN